MLNDAATCSSRIVNSPTKATITKRKQSRSPVTTTIRYLIENRRARSQQVQRQHRHVSRLASDWAASRHSTSRGGFRKCFCRSVWTLLRFPLYSIHFPLPFEPRLPLAAPLSSLVHDLKLVPSFSLAQLNTRIHRVAASTRRGSLADILQRFIGRENEWRGCRIGGDDVGSDGNSRSCPVPRVRVEGGTWRRLTDGRERGRVG